MGGVGQLLGGRYEPVRVLARDGNSETVRARDHQHGRDVWLRVRSVTTPAQRDQLLAQARALLQMRPHSGLATVRDDFFDGDKHVLVRDWVDGVPLSDELAGRGDPGLPASTVLGWLSQVAGALDHLHRHEPPLLHGDVSSANLVLTPDGRVVLVGSAIGLPAETAGPADDVLGLASTALTLLTGVARVNDPAAWEGVDPALAKVARRALRRGLDPDPARRPTTARELIERLNHAYEADLPTGELTFCLTDIEESTPLWEAHPDAMHVVMARLHELIAETVEEHGGRLPRSQGEGDSTLSVFRSARDAAAAVLAAHRALAAEPWPEAIVLRVRAGLHTGPAEVREGDYFGPTVNRTARLRRLAGGGETMVSAATAALLADALPPAAALIARGSRQLKGLARPESVFELVDEGAVPVREAGDRSSQDSSRAVAWAPIPLPQLLSRAEPTAYVGREGALAAIRDRWTDAGAGGRLLFAIGGVPGIGKTRLASEAARALHEEGATVLFGRSYEQNLVPYQPVVEALRHLVAGCPDDLLVEHARAHGPYVARLVPELGDRLPHLPDPLRDDPETERYLLFEAVAGLLKAATHHAPLLLVIDDLQWADKPTLLLLCHVLRTLPRVPLLMLGTYRETEVDRPHPLAHALVDLRRDGLCETMHLGGLDDAEVAGLIDAFDVRDVPPALAETVSRDTEGNPFFIGEVLRHLAERNDLQRRDGRWVLTAGIDTVGVPDSVRDVLDRRLARLPDDVVRLLQQAAVIGRDFDLDVLVGVSGVTVDDAIDRLELALTAHVLTEDPERFGRYSFAHALIRQVLYGDLSFTKRALEHRRVGEALEELAASGDDEHLRALAHHFLSAGSAVDPEKAVAHARRAGQAAMDALSYEEAATIFDRALAIVSDTKARGSLLVALAEARLASGDSEAARAISTDAAEVARASGDAELLARAALGFAASRAVGLGAEWGIVDEPLVALLDEALTALPKEDSPLRARLLARLATGRYFSHDQARLDSLSREALDMAHRMGDKRSMAFALTARHAALWIPGTVDERRAIAAEVLALGEALGDRELMLHGHMHSVVVAMELNDRDALDEHIAASGGLADEVNRWQYQWWHTAWTAMRALLEVRLDEAEALAAEALMIGQDGQGHNAINTFAVQTLFIRLHQGRVDELEPMVRSSIEAYPDLPAWWTGLVIVGLGTRDKVLLREGYEHLVQDGFAGVPRDAMWQAAMAMLAAASVMIDDDEGAAQLYDLLAPLAGRNIAIGGGMVYAGPADRYLGILATGLERYETAETHLQRALEMANAMGGHGMAVLTMLDLASMFRARAAVGDAARAVDLCRRAQARAEALGAEALAAFTAIELALAEEMAARDRR